MEHFTWNSLLPLYKVLHIFFLRLMVLLFLCFVLLYVCVSIDKIDHFLRH